MTPTILYIGAPETLDAARAALPGSSVVHATEARDVDAALPHVDAIVDGVMRVHLTRERLARATKLKLVATVTTGVDHIDAEALAERGIPLLTLRDQKDILKEITPTAEHAWLLLLACARQLRAATASTARGEWDRSRFPGVLLKGKTLGVVGCGRLGEWVARYARAFDMQVVGHDPHVDPWPAGIERARDLDDLLARADAVTVHVHLAPETRHLIGAREMMRMKKGAILINTSRGGLVDEAALVDALASGRLGAAGVDVLEGEPDVKANPLVAYAARHDNLVLTPHIGGYAPDAYLRLLAFTCARVVRGLAAHRI